MKNYAAASVATAVAAAAAASRVSSPALRANDDVQDPIIEVCFWQSIIKLWLRFQSNIQDGASSISFLSCGRCGFRFSVVGSRSLIFDAWRGLARIF